MTCCGDRRRALTQSFVRPAPAPAPKPAAAPATSPSPAPSAMSAHAPVLVRYAGRDDIVARGPVTNRPYAFSSARPVQSVDARDAPVLLRSAMFRRA